MSKDYIDRIFILYATTGSHYFRGVLDGALSVAMMSDIITTDEYLFVTNSIMSVQWRYINEK